MTKKKSPASGARTITGISSAVALVAMVAGFQLSANAAEVDTTTPVPLPAGPALTTGTTTAPVAEATPAPVAPAVEEVAPTVDAAPEAPPAVDAAAGAPPEAPIAVVAPDPAPAPPPAPAPAVDPAPAPGPVATTKAS